MIKGTSLLPKSKVDGGCSRLRGLVILRVSVNVGINLKFAIKNSRILWWNKRIILFYYDFMICRNIWIIIWKFLWLEHKKNGLWNLIKKFWDSGFSQTFTSFVFYVLLCCHLYSVLVHYIFINDQRWPLKDHLHHTGVWFDTWLLILEPFDRF